MTREQWEERLPMIQAFVNGAKLEYYNDRLWMPCADPAFTLPVACYRMTPEPKLRPWKPEEVPVGAIIRVRENLNEGRFLITFAGRRLFGQDQNHRAWEYDNALAHCEHSTDNGKTWLPCGVME